ncbi:hypothetical protein DFJ74DRAFT_664549 [Hyaloraphidium curvatum]|nr:hypothetical protein DFJ74DRAFT_664549 [Hyaloraphidium curvatum]
MGAKITDAITPVFADLTADNLLDVSDPVNAQALHTVFLPRIQRMLDKFAGDWNNHRMRTKGHRTPAELMDEWLPGGSKHAQFDPAADDANLNYHPDFQGSRKQKKLESVLLS